MVKNVLHKKLLRDMRHSAMQFFALIVLCMLGGLLFTAIDSIALLVKDTNEVYFEQNRLADFWISLSSADRDALERVRAIDGVAEAQARFSMDMETEMPEDAVLNVTAYDGAMEINIPVILEGEALEVTDLRGCLIQEGFAAAWNLAVGDRVEVRCQGQIYSFIVRGIVNSPEYVSLSDGMATDVSQYGYMLVNAAAFEEIPLTQIVVRLSDGADAAAVQTALRAALPSAFILDRDTHESTATAQSNATMYRSLSIVFPLAAYAVAALIVMTTLSRMIDKERMQIGTLRALGFSKRKIRRHYLCYALVPSVIGALLGVLAGHVYLPTMLWNMLVGRNEYPFLVKSPVSIQAWAMAALTVVISLAICFHTYQKTTRENTASLLRPKPPRDGKRIFLERIGPLWRRLGFNAKMVVRNLMRNKMRTVMSLIGLLCCNALLIASMGLQDSVTATIDNQYFKALSYDISVELNDQAGEAQAYEAHLDADVVECVMESSIHLSGPEREKTVLLTVVKDDQQLLCLGEDNEYVPLVHGGIVLTDKLARTLGVAVGDVITCQLPGDERTFSMTVAQIVINNLSQGAYLTRSTWDGLRKGSFVPTAIYLQNPSEICMQEIRDMEEVTSVETPEEQAENAMIFLNSISVIFALLMLIALALAFVICYNMGLINFAERTREYATLKVLGYHQREIRRLILNENVLITLLAVILSIAPGIGFTKVILDMAESESMRYVAHVTLRSVALSSVITCAFSMFIQGLLTRKVRSIVMVEALKSVE